MSSSRTSVHLGSFVTGEVPLPLEYQYLDVDGNPLNLTGYSAARFQWGLYDRHAVIVNPVTETATVSSPSTGKVRYAWDGDEFDVTGPHAGQFFVSNGLNQFASLLITWQVCASPAAPPTV